MHEALTLKQDELKKANAQCNTSYFLNPVGHKMKLQAQTTEREIAKLEREVASLKAQNTAKDDQLNVLQTKFR